MNVFLTTIDNYPMRAVRWVIPGWLALGELHMFAGDSKTGKSLTLTTLAALITQGGNFFDGTPMPPRKVAFYTSEDDLQSALRPRFERAGGDPSMLLVGSPKHDAAIEIANGDLAATLAPVRGELGMLVIDGVGAAIQNMTDLAEVRTYLNKAKAVAQELQCAVVFITHTPKGAASKYTAPLDYVVGCGAWTQVPRVAWLLVRDKTAPKENTTLLTAYGNLPQMGKGGIRLTAAPTSDMGVDDEGASITVDALDLENIEVLAGRPEELFANALGLDGATNKPQPKNQAKINEALDLLTKVLSETDGFHKWEDVRDKTLSEFSGGVKKAVLDYAKDSPVFKVASGRKGSTSPRQLWIALDREGLTRPVIDNISDATWMKDVADIKANPAEENANGE